MKEYSRKLKYLLTFILYMHTLISAVEKLSVKKLYSYNSEDELKQYVHYENIEHILEGVHNTVKHRLQLGHSLDGLQRAEHPKHSERLHGAEVLACFAAPVYTQTHRGQWRPMVGIRGGSITLLLS